MRDAVYQLQQRAFAAWLRRRERAALAGVSRFCLFVGYPRSGHSIVGAFVNAHRRAVIAHELDAPRLVLAGCTRETLYARILARARWFHLRGSRTNYDYRVPTGWQGRFERLDVIGDKRGGAVTRCLAEHPDFLDRLRALVGVPIRLLHVVRNPFDNVAAISRWHRLSLEASADFYFHHCETTTRLGALCTPDELHTLRHEAMLADVRGVLAGVCTFLDLDAPPPYLDACARVTFGAPTRPRTRIEWPTALVRDVERRARAFPFLDGYAFDADAPETRRATRPS